MCGDSWMPYGHEALSSLPWRPYGPGTFDTLHAQGQDYMRHPMITQTFFSNLRAMFAMDRDILSTKQGLQKNAHRSHQPVLPTGEVQRPMVSNVEPIRLHPAPVLRDKVCAVNRTTDISLFGLALATKPDASQTSTQCQEPQQHHADRRPRTRTRT